MEEDPGSATSAEPSTGAGTLRPGQKHEAPGSSNNSSNAAPANLTNSKRRRGLGVVTPNACTECRKKRAKCDGQRPCGRCKSQKDVECVYEVPVRQSKENLRHEIDSLKRQRRINETVLSALVRSDIGGDVLQKLQNGQTVENISEWVGRSAHLSPATAATGLPGFARQREPRGGVSLPPLNTYGDSMAPPDGYAQVGMSPVAAQGHSAKQELDSNSPWNFSTHSQTVSQRSSSHPDALPWLHEGPPRSRVGMWLQDQSSADTSRYRGMDQILAPLDSPEVKVSPDMWTQVTADFALVQHLLALYFCWEYPTFASFSKEHFLKDFNNGKARYCSSILVNALLALGCRFSTQPNTRANPKDARTAGDHFFKEALRLFHRETDRHTLTTIQALGIMSIREASCGRDSESWYYAGQSIRLSIELGLHRLQDEGNPDELAVKAATFWGAFGLDHAWSLATGSLPQCSCFPNLPPKPAIIDDIEASLWIPYTDDGAPLQRSCEQPSNVRSVYKCFCELSELVHQSLYVLHCPGKPLTSRDLLHIYTQYLNWYDSIPEVLRLGHNFTPAVLFTHMYYHFAILLLFRPLIKLQIIGSAILPRDVCIQAADAIQALLRSYSQLYTLRRTPSFVPYFVLTSSIMHLAIGAGDASISAVTPTGGSDTSTAKPDESEGRHSHPTPRSTTDVKPEPTSPHSNTAPPKLGARVTEALSRGIADLAEMAPCHHFAEQALNILRYLAKKWDIKVEFPQHDGAITVEDAEKLVEPSTSSLNFFIPHVREDDFAYRWGAARTKALSGMEEQGPQTASAAAHERDALSGFEKMEGIVTDGETAEDEQMHDQPDSSGVPVGPGAGAGPVAHTVKSIENPLFWPFPMQGRPMLPEGVQLEEAGFAPL